MRNHTERICCAALLACLTAVSHAANAAPGSIHRPAQGFVGINCAIWDADLDTPRVVGLLKAAGVTALRWPGGSTSDAYDWTHPPAWGASTAQFADLAHKLGAQATITTNYGTGSPQMGAAWVAYCNASVRSRVVIGCDESGRNWRTAGYWASLRAARPLATDDGLNVLRVGHPQPYAFGRWEIGNECYGSWEADSHRPQHDPALYAEFAAQAARLMRKVDPKIQVGIVVTGIDRPFYCQEAVIDPISGTITSEWTPLVLSALSKHGMRPDFVAYHHYALDPGAESDAALFADPARIPAVAADLRTLIDSYFPPRRGERVAMDCTECNSVTSNPGPQTTGLAEAIYYGRIAQAMRAAGFEDMIWWVLENGKNTSGHDTRSSLNRFPYGDYGILGTHDMQDLPYPVYYAIKNFANSE